MTAPLDHVVTSREVGRKGDRRRSYLEVPGGLFFI